MTSTCGASGIAAPICLNVSGLVKNKLTMTDEQLSASKGIFALKVQGLTVSGGGAKILLMKFLTTSHS